MKYLNPIEMPEGRKDLYQLEPFVDSLVVRHIRIVQDQVGLPQVPLQGHVDALETQDWVCQVI